MPRYSIERPPSRRERAMQQTQLDMQQQQQDANMQSDLLKQAISLYGLQQDRALAPERLRTAQLQNDALEFENAWAQPMAEARHAATMGLAGQRNDKVGISPIEAAQLVQYKIWTPDQAREALMSPEQRAIAAQQRATEEAARQQAIAADQAMQGGGAPSGASPGFLQMGMNYGPAQMGAIPEVYRWLSQLIKGVANPPPNTAPIPSHESSYPSYIN